MLACPGCGADLKYDINQGKLVCDYCSTDYSPTDDRLKQKAAQEEEVINAKVFTCPQCGGEMYTTDIDATAYCSYCGASNILQSRLEGVDRPQKIIPFTVTKEECLSAFHKLAGKTLYAPSEFKKESGDEKLRPLYVPYKLYSLTLDGNADLYGQSSFLDGIEKKTVNKQASFGIHGKFENIAFDASAGFDDTLAEQIAPFQMEKSRDFDSVYLAGSYANIPDVDNEVYREKTLQLAAQKSLDAMHSNFEGKSVTLADYPDGSSVSDHLPVTELSDYTAFFPVWFLSFRKGNRIAYAAVNGQTGKVYSDIPVSLPAFWAGCLALAVPLFLILNLFVTMRPTTGLLLSCLLSLAASILYAGNYGAIQRREKHLDDLGYQAAEDTGQPGERTSGNRVLDWMSGREKRSAARMKRSPLEWLMSLFMIWPYIVIAGLVLFFLPVLFWACLTVGSAVYCLRKTGGKITFWSAILIILAAAGLTVREMNLVSDLWSYGFSIAILAATAVSMTQLIRQYNLLSTRPLPLLFRNGKAPDSSAGTGAGILLALMISASLLVQFLHPYTVQAGQQEPQYNIYIEDYEDLLTEEEETNLYYKMAEVTPYGNAVFVSCNQTDTTALDYAKNLYYSNFGNDSGTILLIDMGTREIALYSAGWNNTVIGAEEGYIITDNIYQYASAGDYYQCAASAFEQAATLLKGGNIARPMKYINNALLALILAVLLNYLALCLQSMKRSSGRESMVAGSINEPRVSGVRWNTLQSVSVFSFVALCTVLARFIIQAMLESGFSGGGGGGGSSSSGGSSSGASGSGGSHRF